MFESSEIDADSIRFACKVSEIVVNNTPDSTSLKDLALSCLCSYAIMCRACDIDKESSKLVADKLLESAFQAMDKFGVRMFKEGVNA